VERKRNVSNISLDKSEWLRQPLIEDTRLEMLNKLSLLKEELDYSEEPQLDNPLINAVEINNFLNGPVSQIMKPYLKRTGEYYAICDMKNWFETAFNKFPSFALFYSRGGIYLYSSGEGPEKVTANMLQRNWDFKTHKKKLIEKFGKMNKKEVIETIEEGIYRINKLADRAF